MLRRGGVLMNDIQLRCFLAAAKYENFTKAAETMFLAQPVLGRHISNLEKELGFALFERNRKTVRLTENGRLFETFAKDTMERYYAMGYQVQENLRRRHMNLIIGSVDGQCLENYFAPALKHIAEHYPDMRISAIYCPNTKKLFDALNSGHIDVLISGYDVVKDMQTVTFQQIRSTRSCFAVSTAHPLGQKEKLTAEDFQGTRFILRSAEDSRASREMQLEVADKYHITDFITVSNTKTLTMLVKSGVGVTAVPDSYELCFDPGIRCVDIPDGHTFIEGLIWNKDNGNPAISVFCEALDRLGCCT